MTERQWNGARWWKFDFHAHTPVSEDYGKGKDQAHHKQRTPREWLLDYMKAGIDCVAITDHNSGAWVDTLKSTLCQLDFEKPSGYRNLTLFPGVEISINGGTHLLAIFGSEKNSSDIDNLLYAIGYNGTKGSCDSVTRESFVNVVEKVFEAGGIPIPAHVDEDNGLFKLSGTTLEQSLENKNIAAIELVDPTNPKPQAYTDKKLQWTEVLGSDAHHPYGESEQMFPGSCYTWVKMGSPSIEGLQLALLDGRLSVLRSDQETGNPNEHSPLALDSIEISQARYMGRPVPFEIKFNPWLNTLIGGRGTGKSTVVELMRIALRRQDELPENLKSDFEKYGATYPNRDDDGLLTKDSTIRVTYQKDGSRFMIQWNPAGNLDPIEQETGGAWQRAMGDVRQRFPMRIYSQKQVFQLASAPLSLLKVVDEAPEVNYHSWAEKWREEEARFLSLRAKAREIEAGLAEEPRLKGELEDVKQKLSIFEQAGHTEILKAYQKSRRQQRDVEAWEKNWIDSGEQLRNIATEIVPDFLENTSFDQHKDADTDLLNLAADVHNSLDTIRNNLESLASQADHVAERWQKNKSTSRWKQSVDAAQQKYQKLREKLTREGAGDPSAYGELVQRRQTIEQRLKELYERKQQVYELNAQAEEHLQRLIKIRRDLTESRRQFLQDTLCENRYVQIEVVPYGARETVEHEFRRLLQRENGGFEKDIGSPGVEGLLGELYKDFPDTHDFEQHFLDMKNKVKKIASKQCDEGSIADRRFANHICKLPPESFDRLDLWFPEDSLSVQYSPTGDGKHFRSIQEGSPGQKTAALLAFLLSYGEEPLILDQPEDDLDNHLIYDLIVSQLREVKRKRQVIVVTHNANIVVNGDAELVIALTARRGQTKIECEGSLQEKKVRDSICEIMEGGRPAFEARYRRIALEGRYV